MESGVDPAVTLSRLVFGYALSQAVYVAAKLGVPDLLAHGARDGADLARATNTHAPSLSRLLRLLAAHEVLAEVAENRFALAPMGALLRSDAVGSQRPYAIMTMELEFPAWGQLLHAVTTGEPGFDRAFGQPYWPYLASTPAGAVLDAAMVGLTRWQADAIVATYDFARCGTVVDVGGGHGTLLAAILAAHPTLRGVLFDAPQVVEGARVLLEQRGVLDRCTLVGGDFLQSVAPGADTYVLKWIVHDWDDAHAQTILAHCRQAMRPGGRLLLVEGIVPAGTATPEHAEKLADDVLMMVLFGGRERTRTQFAQLLDAAGFALAGVSEAGPGLCVIEAVPK
ncbi:methyltransferase [bacterium]|nr:methyltransferase [bacterium]